MSLAPEHPLALSLSKGTAGRGVRRFVERQNGRTGEKDSRDGGEGRCFTGAPVESMTGARMPIFVANFVLMQWNRCGDGSAYP
jgi:leucyl-tRNA synthetase